MRGKTVERGGWSNECSSGGGLRLLEFVSEILSLGDFYVLFDRCCQSGSRE